MRVFIDCILINIFKKHISETILSNIVFIPIGGYGRGLLAPYSDIDLLFLVKEHHKNINEEIQNVLYDLWDLKLVLGYSIHTIAEAQEKLKTDMNFCTACLERRFLFGSERLYENFSMEYVSYQNETKIAFLDAKMKERETRHLKNGDSRYLVEPDIKNGKGGLRDLQTLYWVGKYLYNFDNIAEFPHHNIFSHHDMRIINKAEQFLWSIRFMIHHCTKRAHEKLNFDIQKEISILLGYKDKSGRLAVEQFMKHYFIVARTIGHITRIFCHALEMQHRMAHKKVISYIQDKFVSYKLNTKNYILVNNRIDFSSEDGVRDNPLLMIEIFQIADKQNISFHPNALRTIRKYIYLISGNFLEKKEPFLIFRNILCNGNHTEKTLRSMNESGVLGRLIPDFGRITALMQFNMYHHYTIDEHLIQTVGVMHNIAQGKLIRDHPLSSEIMKNIEMHDALFLAVLLHDMAKGRDEDHSIAGAQIAKELAPKMGFSKEETDVISWLVLHHLAMSDISQKRDLSDSQTSEDFADFIRSAETLKLLLCLTVADIRAVGPGVWNGWKGELLRTLYYSTLAVLHGNVAYKATPQQAQQYKEKFISSFKNTLSNHSIIDMLPDNFWLKTDFMTQKRLINLIDKGHKSEKYCAIETYPDPFCDVTEIDIFTEDYPGLFATISGALSSSGVEIYDAHIFTSKGKWVIDQFRIQDILGKAIIDRSYLHRIQKNVQKSIENRITDFSYCQTTSYPVRTKRETVFSLPTTVIFDNTTSANHTIIEIETLNRPFLLYDISCALKSLNITLVSAHINSFGEKAIDVFYVKDRFGFKILDQRFLTIIKEKIYIICK